MGLLATDLLEARLGLLGLTCESVPTDHLTSATTALACFPIYMIANAHVWISGKSYDAPEEELPSAKEFLADLEPACPLEPAHRELLNTLRFGAKAPDRVFYEYALETLDLFLRKTSPKVADQTRLLIAQGLIRMAEATAKTSASTARVGSAERAYLQHLIVNLRMSETPAALEILDQFR